MTCEEFRSYAGREHGTVSEVAALVRHVNECRECEKWGLSHLKKRGGTMSQRELAALKARIAADKENGLVEIDPMAVAASAMEAVWTLVTVAAATETDTTLIQPQILQDRYDRVRKKICRPLREGEPVLGPADLRLRLAGCLKSLAAILERPQ